MPAPNLIISDIDVGSQDISLGETVTQTFVAGSSFTVEVAVRNDGDAGAASSTAAAFLEDAAGNLIPMGTNSTGTLSAGNTNTDEALTVSIPSSFGPGTYRVVVMTDYNNQVTNESSETDNLQFFFIQVSQGQPNLIISDIDVGSQDISLGETVTQTFVAGSSFTVEVAVRNDGDAGAASSTAAAFLEDAAGNLIPMGTNSTGTLSAGNTNTDEALTVSIPSSFGPGTYRVVVMTDYDNQVTNESSETDNLQFFFINVVSPPVDSVREGTDTLATLTAGSWAAGTINAEPIGGDGVTSDLAGGFIDKDWYAVTLAADRTYTFDAESVSLSTGRVFFRLYDSAGGEVSATTSGEGGAPSFSFSTAGQSGSRTFYVAVGAGDTNNSDFRTATGDFRVRFTDSGAVVGDTVREGTDTLATLTAGSWAAGTINAEPIGGDGVTSDLAGGFIDKDWYAVTLAADRTYTFYAESVSLNTGRVFFRLYDSAGGEVSAATSGEGGVPSFSFSTAGQSGSRTFYVAVGAGDTNNSDFRTATGDFRVRFTDGGAVVGDSVREGTDSLATLTGGSWVTGTINAEPIGGDGVTSDLAGGFVDKDWYAVTLAADRTYTFDAESISLSTGRVFFRLYDSAGGEVSAATSGEGGVPSFSFSTAGQSGSRTFYVAVGAGDTNNSDFRTATGDFRVRFTDGGAVTTTDVAAQTLTNATLAVGATVLSEIQQDDVSGDYVDADYFRVTLTGGQRYTFSADASVDGGDTLDEVFIRLRDAQGRTLSPDIRDDGASPDFVFDTPGIGQQTFYLAISAGGGGAWWDDTGAYSVSLTAEGTAPPTNYRPTAQSTNHTEAPGTVIPLTELFSYGDLNGLSDIVSFAVQDRTSLGGHLTYLDNQMDPNTVYERPISQIGDWAFVVGPPGTDYVGFNAIDSEDAFNPAVVASVSGAQFQGPAPRASADDLFGQKTLSTLAQFAAAAYFDQWNQVSELEQDGWNILSASELSVPSILGELMRGNYFINAFDLENMVQLVADVRSLRLPAIDGVGSAIVALSPDENSMVISFTGTDSFIDWVQNFLTIDSHFDLFDPLFEALDVTGFLSDPEHTIYVTGHSLGAAMAQKFVQEYGSIGDVVGIGFANPGLLDAPAELNSFASIQIARDPIQIADVRADKAGDEHHFRHGYELVSGFSVANLHDIDLYLDAVRKIEQSSSAERILSSLDNGNGRESFDYSVALDEQLVWGGEIPSVQQPSLIGSFVSPVTINFGATNPSIGANGEWNFSTDERDTSRLTIDASAFTNTNWTVGADGGEVVLSDLARQELLRFDDFGSFQVNSSWADLNLKLEKFDGTDILKNTVYVSGGTGNDRIDGSATDRRIVATGGEGNDTFVGGAPHDHFAGEGGNDVLDGGLGNDTLLGGVGNDVLYGDSFRAAYALAQAQQVYRLYQATLDRAPDTAGQIGWTAQLAEGTQTLVQVAAGFVGSREFQNVYGALNNSQFVTQLYQNVLDRAPDAGGLAGWVAALNAGSSRAQVVTGFSESREFVTKSLAAASDFTAARVEAKWTDDVFRLYQATLDRAPDAVGFMDWLGRLGGGTTFLSAVSGFVGSREFQRNYGALDDTAFVTLLYRNVLNRDPDSGGLANWLAHLSGGTTRAQVVEGFVQAREFVNATAGSVKDFVRGLGGGDELVGGEGDNRLWGGSLADTFVFDATEAGRHGVMDLEAWDYLSFGNFSYDQPGDIRAHMVQQGANVLFQDQGVTVTLVNTQLAALTDDMFVF